ncbi:5104_t:CDS:2, partial [Cetraspora pellucida]
NKLLRSGFVILLKDEKVDGLEVINVGKYSLFGDDGTDIICNWNGYPLLVQCKFRSICDNCVSKKKYCTHSYWKADMINDIKKLDKKLSEYKIPIFGIFIISERIKIHDDVNKLRFANDMVVVNYSNELNKQINMLGEYFLVKTQKMEWSISLDNKKLIELQSAYRHLEQIVDDKVEKVTKKFFENTKKILYYIRQAYYINSLDDICKLYNNLYGSPGGKVEDNEEIKEAAERELFEETGILVINKLDLIMINNYENRC